MLKYLWFGRKTKIYIITVMNYKSDNAKKNKEGGAVWSHSPYALYLPILLLILLKRRTELLTGLHSASCWSCPGELGLTLAHEHALLLVYFYSHFLFLGAMDSMVAYPQSHMLKP